MEGLRTQEELREAQAREREAAGREREAVERADSAALQHALSEVPHPATGGATGPSQPRLTICDVAIGGK